MPAIALAAKNFRLLSTLLFRFFAFQAAIIQLPIKPMVIVWYLAHYITFEVTVNEKNVLPKKNPARPLISSSAM
jgi:hypothetical protein